MPLTLRPSLRLAAAAAALTAASLPAAPQVLLYPDPQSHNCPLTLVVQPRFSGGISLVPGAASSRDRAGVHLRLADPDGRVIRHADITLHGVAALPGAQPASLAPPAQSPSQTFHVVGKATTPGILDADLWLAHATAIRSVSVIAVDFADAPGWTASVDSSCVAAPNGTRLLGSLR